MKLKLTLLLAGASICAVSNAQNRAGGDPKLSEIYTPVAPVVKPGNSPADAPSDAIILFDGKDLSKWKAKNGGAVAWTIENGAMTVKPGTGEISTKDGFGDCQLHIEWRAPSVVKGEGQGRGNSGIFLMSNYELQILDSYNNKTYSNGQAGSIYKQLVPLANANKAPGEWQTYDVIFRAPRFNEQGILVDAARITVLHNGVLIQNNAAIWGGTQYIGIASYDKHENKLPIILQDHGDLVSFRNIWIRNL